jgi:hypothetical protein
MKPKLLDLSWKGIERSLKRFTTGGGRGSIPMPGVESGYIDLDMTVGVKISK